MYGLQIVRESQEGNKVEQAIASILPNSDIMKLHGIVLVYVYIVRSMPPLTSL